MEGPRVARAASSGRAIKKAGDTPAPPQRPNRERPPVPQRYQASKDELLEFYRQMLLFRRCE
jgi:pyruvate dehydrogenase E1 component alpha subunit